MNKTENKLDDANLEADELLTMAKGNGKGSHGNFGKIPIKTEFGMPLMSEPPRKRKFSELDLDPDLIEILDSPVGAAVLLRFYARRNPKIFNK